MVDKCCIEQGADPVPKVLEIASGEINNVYNSIETLFTYLVDDNHSMILKIYSLFIAKEKLCLAST